ncbi:MAG: mismatch repair protein MutS, partial [Candidatus Dependentiae bacterium]|nr:mismatch repair protein MutS [Candidatus Dependentiae bacterium]
MISWYLSSFLLICCLATLSGETLILPKEAHQLTPVQQQYEYLLIAFRQSLGEEKRPAQQLTVEATDQKDKLSTTLSLSLPTQTEMALELMSQLDTPTYALENRALFEPATWQSLRLIDQEPSVLSGIAPEMQTLLGKIFLARLLTTPIIDVQRIQTRQAAIQALCENPSVLADIISICGTIKQIQEQLLGLTSKEHPLYDKGLRIYQHEFFFRSFGPRGNKRWNRVAKMFGDIWYGAGIIALPMLNIKGILGYAHTSKEEIESKFNVDHRVVAATLATLIAYNAGIQLPGFIAWIRARFKAMNYFYDALTPLKVFFTATQRLKEYFDQNPALQCLGDEIDITLTINHPQVKKLRDIVMGKAFNSRTSAHILGGDLILIIDLLRNCHKSILKGIGIVGAFDAYSSLASWYLKSQNSEEKPLCFATFVEGTGRPVLEIQNFWHVLSRGTPVLNSIKLGENNPQNAIITGIFESGKSTVLQSIALNVLCAQSIGIGLARSYTATPYSSINIYANIKDDLANDRSLFKTELYRALQLLVHIKQMPSGHFSFTIADATFTGTEADAGQAAAYAVTRYLGELP